MINKVILVGNVGKDPEVKSFGENMQVAKFPFATSETFKDKSGEKKTDTQWHNVSVWGKLSTVVEKYVKKGSKLYLEGKIKYSSSGEGDSKKYFTEIVVNTMQMLGEKPSGDSRQDQDDNVYSAELKKAQIKLDNAPEPDDLPF